MKKKRRKRKLFLLVLVFSLMIWILSGCGKQVIMEMIYPIKYQEYVEKYAEEYGLDKYIVYAVIKVESGFDPEASSKVEAKGLMQLMDKTASECNEKAGFGYNIPEDLYDPEKNIRMGCYYLKTLLDTYGNMQLAITAYNGGTGSVDKWLKDEKLSDGNGGLARIPYDETEKYVAKVFKAFSAYNELYNKN